MMRLWMILGVISSACFYGGRVVVVGGCRELLLFQSDTNSSLSLALDGDYINTCTATTAQTNYEWILDMGTAYYIDHVVVYLNATEYSSQGTLLLDIGTECCDLANFYTDCYVTFQPTYSNASLLYDCQSTTLSHIRYMRLRPQKVSPVQICEVQIFGCRSQVTGTTNVALFKPATQHSIYSPGNASCAVDNNTNPRFLDGHCTHTSLVTNTSLWWEVNLTLAVPVVTLTIYNRGDCCDFRLKNIQILVGWYNTSAGRSSPTYTTCAQRDEIFPAVQHLVCGQPLCGQLVKVAKGKVNAEEALSLCEVQVYAGTLVAGKPRTNEIVTTTTSSPVTTPGTQINMTSSGSRATDTQSMQTNTRAETTTLGSTSLVGTTNQLPISEVTVDDVSAPGRTWNDADVSALESLVQLSSPQPSAGESSTTRATDVADASPALSSPQPSAGESSTTRATDVADASPALSSPQPSAGESSTTRATDVADASPALSSPQPSAGESSTTRATDVADTSPADTLNRSPGDAADVNTVGQQPSTGAAVEQTALESDGKTLTLLGVFTSAIESTEITAWEVPVNVNVTDSSFHSALPSLGSATEVTTLDSPSDQHSTPAALVVSGEHYLQTSGRGEPVTIETDATRLYSAVTAPTEAPLASIETSSAVPELSSVPMTTLQRLAVISSQTRDVTATGLASLDDSTSVVTDDSSTAVSSVTPVSDVLCTTCASTSTVTENSKTTFVSASLFDAVVLDSAMKEDSTTATTTINPNRAAANDDSTSLTSDNSITDNPATTVLRDITIGDSSKVSITISEVSMTNPSFINSVTDVPDTTRLGQPGGTTPDDPRSMVGLEVTGYSHSMSFEYPATEPEFTRATSTSLEYLNTVLPKATSINLSPGQDFPINASPQESAKLITTGDWFSDMSVYVTDVNLSTSHDLHAFTNILPQTADLQIPALDSLSNVLPLSPEALLDVSELASDLPATHSESPTTRTYQVHAVSSTSLGADTLMPSVADVASLNTFLSAVNEQTSVTSPNGANSYPSSLASAFLDFSLSILTDLLPSSSRDYLTVDGFTSDVPRARPITLTLASEEESSFPFVASISFVSFTNAAIVGEKKSTAIDGVLSIIFNDDDTTNPRSSVPDNDDISFWSSSLSMNVSHVTTPRVPDSAAQNESSYGMTELIPVLPEPDLKPAVTDFNENTFFIPLFTSDIAEMMTRFAESGKTVEVDSGSLSPVNNVIRQTDPMLSHEAISELQLLSSTLMSNTLEVATKHVPESTTTEFGAIRTVQPTNTSDGWNSRLLFVMTTTVPREGTTSATVAKYNDSENAATSALTAVTLVTRFASSTFDNARPPVLFPTPLTDWTETAGETLALGRESQSLQGLRSSSTSDTLSLSSSKIVPGQAVLSSSRAGLPEATTSSTPVLGATRTPPSFRLCACACQQRKSVLPGEEGSAEYLSQLRSAIQDELKVARDELAKQIRKKISAPDRRTSAAVWGIVVAMATTALVGLVVVVPDVIRFIAWLRGRCSRHRYAPAP